MLCVYNLYSSFCYGRLDISRGPALLRTLVIVKKLLARFQLVMVGSRKVPQSNFYLAISCSTKTLQERNPHSSESFYSHITLK